MKPLSTIPNVFALGDWLSLVILYLKLSDLKIHMTLFEHTAMICHGFYVSGWIKRAIWSFTSRLRKSHKRYLHGKGHDTLSTSARELERLKTLLYLACVCKPSSFTDNLLGFVWCSLSVWYLAPFFCRNHFNYNYSVDEMSRLMTKPTKWRCVQRRLRSDWAFAQSDHSLRCPHEERLGS